MDPLEFNNKASARFRHARGLLESLIYRQRASSIKCCPDGANRRWLAKPGPAAALAFYHLVALLQQALALAILAFLLFLDVGTFLARHDVLQAAIKQGDGAAMQALSINRQRRSGL
jgi:hypothetical protein